MVIGKLRVRLVDHERRGDWSIVRNSAGGVMEDVVLLPHRFEGELLVNSGAMSEASEQEANTIHNAIASAAPGASTI
jgi:hypothetical protein